jgi:hypothetical protein
MPKRDPRVDTYIAMSATMESTPIVFIVPFVVSLSLET